VKAEELKEYLGIVVDMEKNIFMQGQMMAQWEREIAGLGKAHEFQMPPKPEEKPMPERVVVAVNNTVPPQPPTPPEQPKILRYPKRAFWITAVISSIFYVFFYISQGLILELLVAAPIACIFVSTIVAVITAAIISFVSYDTIIDTIKGYHAQKRQYAAAVEAYPSVLEQHQQRQRQIEQERQQRYQQACEKIEQANGATRREYQKKFDEYQNDVLKDQQRVKLENIKKEVLKAELSQMRELNAASKKTLEQIYDKNIVFPKYRNMVMVCSLYEYVCTGRCDTLEGHEGAYNLLELEIRLDKIVTGLDRVIELLGRIQQSQYMVYSAIQDANRQSAKILESTYQMTNQLQAFQTSNWKMLGGIQADIQRGILAADQQSVTMAQMTQQLSALQATSALTAYQTERTRAELHYMNRMNYLSGKNDEVFFNLPPM